MVSGVVNNAIALIDEALRTAVFSRVVDIGFVVGAFWQCCMIVACVGCVIVEFVTTNHHADGCPRVEIPLFKCLAGLEFVKLLAFVFANIVAWQLVELAQVCRHGIACGVLAGFLNGIEDRGKIVLLVKRIWCTNNIPAFIV